MAKSNISTPSIDWPKGGTTSMFGKQKAVQQAPGVTSHQGPDGGDWPKGGSKHMFGKGSASKAEEGRTAKGSQ